MPSLAATAAMDTEVQTVSMMLTESSTTVKVDLLDEYDNKLHNFFMVNQFKETNNRKTLELKQLMKDHTLNNTLT